MKKRVGLMILVVVLGIVLGSRRPSGSRDFELRFLYTTNTAGGTVGVFELRNNSADVATLIDFFWGKDSPPRNVDYFASGGPFSIPAKGVLGFSTPIPTNGGPDRFAVAVLPAVTSYGKGPVGWARNWLIRLSRPMPAVAWRFAGGTSCRSEVVGEEAIYDF